MPGDEATAHRAGSAGLSAAVERPRTSPSAASAAADRDRRRSPPARLLPASATPASSAFTISADDAIDDGGRCRCRRWRAPAACVQNAVVETPASVIAMISAERMKSVLTAPAIFCRSSVAGSPAVSASLSPWPCAMRQYQFQHLLRAFEAEKTPPAIKSGVIAQGAISASSSAPGSRKIELVAQRAHRDAPDDRQFARSRKADCIARRHRRIVDDDAGSLHASLAGLRHHVIDGGRRNAWRWRLHRPAMRTDPKPSASPQIALTAERLARATFR